MRGAGKLIRDGFCLYSKSPISADPMARGEIGPVMRSVITGF
jgi:hypothetical protein